MTNGLANWAGSDVYESDRALGEYLLFHYGSKDEQFPWASGPLDALGFPRRSVDELIDKKSLIISALDLGCAVGGSSFVLSAIAQKVLGIDYSKTFINACQTILRDGKLIYQYHEEGKSWKDGQVNIENIPSNLTFEIGDACNLREDLGKFDLVHAANLLCRLPDPLEFLKRLPDLVIPGGQLILTTPFTWLEEFTPKEKWLDGGGSAILLKEFLCQGFDLELEKDLPFLIREHRRKFQYSMALGMRWRRKKDAIS